jgi:hypothetical protein
MDKGVCKGRDTMSNEEFSNLSSGELLKLWQDAVNGQIENFKHGCYEVAKKLCQRAATLANALRSRGHEVDGIGIETVQNITRTLEMVSENPSKKSSRTLIDEISNIMKKPMTLRGFDIFEMENGREYVPEPTPIVESKIAYNHPVRNIDIERKTDPHSHIKANGKPRKDSFLNTSEE